MEKDFKFAVEDIQRLNVEEYDENEYCVARMKFLSTRPNSHGLKFSEEVLKRDAKTVLGTWIVAEMLAGDFLTHTPAESIIGIVPKDQDVEFVEADDGYLDAYVDTVLSKRYAKDAYDVFVKDNDRSVSIEFNYSHPEDDEYEVESYVIRGTTILGKTVNPSVPQANITVTRFSQEDADKFFAKVHNNSLTVLKKFVEERKESMAEQEKLVAHPIDTSKEAIYDGEWDGQKVKQNLVKEKNFKTLAPKVCMKLEPGWEDREITKLGYPVMMLHDGKWVYAVKGLSSALGYAKKENETEVINKVEKIYKKLGLDSDRKEEDAKMAETITNFEIEGRKAWAKVIKKVQDHEGKGAYVDSIEDNHIIYTKGDVRYRVEADIKVDKDDKSVDADIKWDTVKKDADQKMAEDEAKCEDKEEKKMSDDCDCKDDDDEEDFAKKCAEMEKKIEERDNIIMENENKMKEMEEELSELREFKKTCMEKDKACAIESVMNEVKDFMNDEMFKSLRDEGMACDFAQIDAWSNKVKAVSFEMVKGVKKNKSDSIMRFSAAIDTTTKPNSVWDRLKNL